ncbi:hypothetical protein [Planktotalea sp.]|uniref:hypothetical protein n=1 Tax=Planktotalea sp. TaxID=2029877 RepID=UPI0025FA36C9|nr:hypothetical protein [Planktotalea sp.]
MHLGLIGGIGPASTVVYYQRLTDAIVLSETDLGLAFYGQTTEYKVIDALDVHVDLLVSLATGKAQLNDHAVGV